MDDGDPETTNLYVGHLAPTVTEEMLHEAFGKFGEVYSVKIMWPRTDVSRGRGGRAGGWWCIGLVGGLGWHGAHAHSHTHTPADETPAQNRPQEERARKRNCGFVSFYRRADAEDAKVNLHDTELQGYRMTIG